MKIEVYNLKTITHAATLYPSGGKLSADYMGQLNIEVPIEYNDDLLTGFLAVLSDDKNNQIFVGTILMKENEKVTIASFLDKFNVKMLPGTFSGHVEDLLLNEIKNNYINSPDNDRNIMGLVAKKNTSTSGTYTITDEGEQFKTTIANIFKIFNVYLRTTFDPNTKKITITCQRAVVSTSNLKNDVEGIEIKGEIKTTRGVNTADIYDEAGNFLDTYVLQVDGVITPLSGVDPALRPPIITFDRFKYSSSGEDTIADYAKSILKGNEYGHQIKININMNMPIIDEGLLGIGDIINLYYNEKQIKTIITGVLYDFNEQVITLTCGFERISRIKGGK